MDEGILKDVRGVHMAEKDSLDSSHNKKKNNNFKKTKKGKAKVGKCKSKGKGKFFLYSKKGHWKKECPIFQNKSEGMFDSILVESCLVVDYTSLWWIDSEAIDHICNSLQGFQLRKRLNE